MNEAMEGSGDNLVILEALRRIASQNPDVIKPAEQSLKAWEELPGFHTQLLGIVLNYNIEVNARWHAIIYFKNGVDRHWRTNTSGISQEEKTVLRQKLLASVHEPVNQIATQLAVVIARIARVDCPRKWPELLPSLLEIVNKTEEVVQHRGLLVLNHVIKSFVSKRLSTDRQIFLELTNNIFHFLLDLWNLHTENFLRQVIQRDDNSYNTLQKALLSLKILRKLLVHGCKDPHKFNDGVLFLNLIFERIKPMLECRHSVKPFNQLQETCEQYIIIMEKVLMDVLDYHPVSYLRFIRPTLEFTTALVFNPENEGLLFEQFTVRSLNLIKGIIISPEYKSRDEMKELTVKEAQRIKLEFFTQSTLVEICLRLLSHCFLLTQDDLNLWDEDPEGFAIEEGGESWKFSLRPCTEILFLALFHEFREVLTPVLLDLVARHSNPCDVKDFQALLQKDAVYNAVGLASFDLFDEIPFDQWFTSTLLKELTIKEPNYRILRRRVIWLVGQWVGVKLSSDLRPVLYECVLPLLAAEEDLVVRITAARTLKIAVDDFEFNTKQFLPYLQSSFSLLFNLLRTVSEGDTKMHVLNVLSFIIERVGNAIRPHSPALVQYLPLLWNESAEHNMLRCAILATLIHLVRGLGPVSETLYPFLVPVLHLSVDVAKPPHVYLLEDGLDLWLTVLENATSLHAEILPLFSKILPILECGSENLRTCLNIVRAFLLLSPQHFLDGFALSVITVCCELLRDMRREGIIAIMKFVEVVMKALRVEGPQLCKSVLTYAIRAVLQSQETPMVMSSYMSVVARAVISDLPCLEQVVELIASDTSQATEDVFSAFLESWIRILERDPQPETRKLFALALASLLTSNVRVVNDKFCAILLAIVEVLHDVTNTDDLGAKIDSLLLNGNDQSEDCCEFAREQDKRMKQLRLNDPVHVVDLRLFLRAQLEQLRQVAGQEAFDDLMQTVDVETMQQLKVYV